jgi:hypothetical protein
MKFINLILFPVALLAFTGDAYDSETPTTSEEQGLVAKPLHSGHFAMELEGAVNVQIDETGLAGAIKELTTSAANRTEWVKTMMEYAVTEGHYKLNVLVFNLNQSYDNDLKNIKYYKEFEYGGTPFGTYL